MTISIYVLFLLCKFCELSQIISSFSFVRIREHKKENSSETDYFLYRLFFSQKEITERTNSFTLRILKKKDAVIEKTDENRLAMKTLKNAVAENEVDLARIRVS